MDQWFVDETRQIVNLSTLRNGQGLASKDVWRIVRRDDGSLIRTRWAHAGLPIDAFAVQQAQQVATVTAVPADRVPESAYPPAPPGPPPAPPVAPLPIDPSSGALYGYASNALSPLGSPTGRRLSRVDVTDGRVRVMQDNPSASPLALMLYPVNQFWFPVGVTIRLGGWARSSSPVTVSTVVASGGTLVSKAVGPVVTAPNQWQPFTGDTCMVGTGTAIGLLVEAALSDVVDLSLTAQIVST